jgi:hypothetical protein
MKTPFSFLLLFLFLLGFGQNPAIKIYVADAENSKNISNAKVCLEGFEIPAIKAQYNKKEKYYYFTEIPKNYNTVMVYHKKYNEKGFQDMNGLPKELKFKLHEPLQNYYDFDYETSNEQPNKKFYNYYVEDPFKIVIRPKKEMSYNDFRNYIYSYINENNIEIEPVNPVWERYKLENNIKENLEPYPLYNDLYLPNEDFYKNEFTIFPIAYYRSYIGHADVKPVSNDSKFITLFFRKKNKEKFKRFNDEIINQLSKNSEINILSVIIPLGNYLENGITFYYNTKRDQEIKYIINQNKIFNKKYKPDFTKVFPIDVFVVEELRHITRMEPANRTPDKIYDLFNYNKFYFPYVNYAYKEENNNRDASDYEFSSSIGLGVLDILEYYPNLGDKY